MSGQAIQLTEHITERGKGYIGVRCKTKTTQSSHAQNMVLLYRHDLDDSTCITSLLGPV